MNTEECCALGAMKAIHYIEQQKLIINSTTIPFMDKHLTVYGYGDLDYSKANENTVIFDTKLQLNDDPSMDHDWEGVLRDSREVFKVINPVVEERNRRARLMNQIGEMRNKIMDVLREMKSDPENIQEQVIQKTRLLDKMPTNGLEKVLEDLQNIYQPLCAKTNIFIPTDFSPKRFVKDKSDGKQAVYDERHNKVAEVVFDHGRMIGEYIEHDLSNYDELRNYFTISPYVVDSSKKYNEESMCFEKQFYYSARREDVKSLSKPIDPLAIVEVGYDEHERIKYIRRKIYNRYIDKATFDENGNLKRIHYNVRDKNGHLQPHCIVFRKNGQLKYYISYNKFLVEWGSTTSRDVDNSFSTIRAFGNYRLKDSGKICVEIDSQSGAAVYFNEYYYALFRNGQIGPKNLDKPGIKMEGKNRVLEKKPMPSLLDTTVTNYENSTIGSIDMIPDGYISSSYSYSDQPYYQEIRSDSKNVVASVSYLVPIYNEKLPLMSLVYNEGKRRVLRKNGNVPPSLLNDAIDDGHNCSLERVKELFFDFTNSGYEGLDLNIPVPDLHQEHRPDDITNIKDSLSDGEFDEVLNSISDERNEPSGNKSISGKPRPDDITNIKDSLSDGEFDEVPDSISDERNEPSGNKSISGKPRPDDKTINKDPLSDEGEIDEVLNSISDERNEPSGNKSISGKPLPVDITDGKDPLSDEGEFDEVPDSISDERNEPSDNRSISVDGRHANPSNEDSISEESKEEQHTSKSGAISESSSSNDERNQDPYTKLPDEQSPVKEHLPEDMEREVRKDSIEEQNEVNRKPIGMPNNEVLNESMVNANQSDHEIYDSGAIDEMNTSARPHLFV